MSMDVEIYAAVLHRVAEVDHGWGKPYELSAWHVLDYAAPDVEHPQPASGHQFDEALRSALRATVADLPYPTFVHSVYEVHDAQRNGPVQVRNGGAFVALGPIYGDIHTASVDAMFYGGHRWARWLRYHLERADRRRQIASSEVLAVS